MGKGAAARNEASFYATVVNLIVVVGLSGFLYLGLQISQNRHGVGISSPAAAKVLPAVLPERAR